MMFATHMSELCLSFVTLEKAIKSYVGICHTDFRVKQREIGNDYWSTCPAQKKSFNWIKMVHHYCVVPTEQTTWADINCVERLYWFQIPFAIQKVLWWYGAFWQTCSWHLIADWGFEPEVTGTCSRTVQNTTATRGRRQCGCCPSHHTTINTGRVWRRWGQ